MCDQAALKEAVQRARQLAAQISQNAPATVKRKASELDDHLSMGTVKVTLAYEKPANSINNDNNKDNLQNNATSRSSYKDNNNYKDNNSTNHHSSRDRSRDRSSSRGDRQDRDIDRDRDSGGYKQQQQDTNGGGGGGNHPRMLNNNQQTGGYGSMLGGYSSGSADERIEIIIPHAVIGLVIGKGGENIKRIQNETGATVRVDPNTVDEKGNKVCTITGTKQAVEGAHNQVASVIENAATNKRPRLQAEGSEQYRMKIPASRTGAIIGKGGETIKSIKQQSGCDIELDKGAKECGPDESVFIIRGTQDKIMKARAMIEARLASRGRDGDNSRGGVGGGSNHSAPKGVATGANAAPVAQFTDLPSNYPAAGQQTSADVSAAWAAYFAQYSNLFNQAGAQPGAVAAAAAANLPYPAGQGLVGATTSGIPQQPQASHQPPDQQQPPMQPSVQATPTQQQPGSQQSQQDYSDQWIEFYLMNGRPDYAEQIIEMKKQQQAQKQHQPPK